MSYKKMDWVLSDQPSDEAIEKLQKEWPCSRPFAILCLQKGLETAEDIQQFLDMPVSFFHDPYLFHDMDVAVERIHQAILEEEKITVYGDYDADGVTATSLLVETLLMLGASVNAYIPDRFSEGYGPNEAAFQTLVDAGTDLIITCDNGIQGHASVDLAMGQGTDVIITDHHEMGETLPEATAVIHPRHPEGAYPFGDLAGVGVAFKLACALLDELAVDFLDLVAIGTVADLVSLTDENRWLVQQGIQQMRVTERIGLKALYEFCAINPATIDETTIGFSLAPRLNAAGRMGDAMEAVDLLLEQDASRALERAQHLDQINENRKFMVEKIAGEALEKAKESSASVLVISGEGWHEGVLGIVASRIVDATHKPTLIFSRNPLTGLAKGSGRSVEGYNLYEALSRQADLLDQFGGHEMAAGLSLQISNLPALAEALNTDAPDLIKEGGPRTVQVATRLEVKDCSLDLIEEINKLGPFGTGNDLPLFQLDHITPRDLRLMGADQSHLKFKTTHSDVEFIGFGFGEAAPALETGTVDVLGQLTINEWMDRKTPQVQLTDMILKKSPILDQRQAVDPALISDPSVTLVFFDGKRYEKAQEHPKVQAKMVLVTSLEEAQDVELETSVLAFMDIPHHPQFLRDVVAGNDLDQVVLAYRPSEKLTKAHLPSREETAKIYTYFTKHQRIDLRVHGKAISQYLQMDPDHFLIIVVLLEEASLIRRNNGIIECVEDPQYVKIRELPAYRRLELRIQTRDYLMQTPADQIGYYLSQPEGN